MKNFRDADVTVTLKGAEWFALICRILGYPLSDEGVRYHNEGMAKLRTQIRAASDAMPEWEKRA